MKNFFIHESSYIDDNVSIGENSRYGTLSHILENSIVGENCSIGQNVVIGPNVSIGNKVKIQNNVSIYDGVLIEDDVFCGPSCVFTNVINPRSPVERKDEFKKTLLKKGCSIGANATIVCGITLGEYSFIGAGAVVTKDVKSFALMVGNPAKQIGWMSISGEKIDLPMTGNQNYVCKKTNEVYSLDNDILSFKGVSSND